MLSLCFSLPMSQALRAQDLVWAKRAGGTSFDGGQGIALDGSGNSYVTGTFVDSATFGPGETNETTLTSAGLIDIFVAKYDASGDLVWAKPAGGTGSDFGLGIAVDGSGNSYATGFFDGSATFGPGETNETTLTSTGSDEIFVAKYDASGDLVWAKRAGGASFDQGQGIAVDGSGNSYVTGDFFGSPTFGPGETNETTLTSAGGDDIFVTKYDASGDLVWAKQAGGTGLDEGNGIAVDGSGNSYVVGNFNGSATFGPGETNETTLTSTGSGEIFVAKYDASGDLVWAKRAGGISFDQGRGIAVDGSGNSYVTGDFVGSATFGPGETNETTLTAAGGTDIVVAKYDASGDLVWAKRAGGTSDDFGFGIAGDGSGNSYVTGFFFVSATFGPGETNETTLTSAGSDDVFVAKYGPPPPPVADAGPDQLVTVAPGGTAMVTLDGSGSSDPDGHPLIFTWTNSFGTAMGVMPTVSLPAGVHIITLTVDDGKGGTDTDTVEITVNQAPVANAGPDQTRIATSPNGAVVALDGSGSSDPEGNPLIFTWTGPFGTAGGVSPTVTLPGGVHTITLTVDNGKGGVDTDTVVVAVRALKVSPNSLSFLFGKSSGASQPLSIRSIGDRVSYSIPRIASWLLTKPDRGESNGETDTIQVIVDPARRAGTYSTTMIIRGNGNIMARIPVTMTVPEGGVPGSPMLRLPDNPAVDAADFIPHGEPGHAMAGKSIIAIFGEGFVADGEFRADTVPLPTKLGGVRVLFDGTAAPLYLVTPGLIHAQVPMGLRGPTATLLIIRDFEKAGSNAQEIEIHDYSPGIFTLSQNGEGQAIVTFANSPDLAAPVGMVGGSRPATAGDRLTIYANGMGPVEPPIENGHNSCEPAGVCLPDGSNVVLHHTTITPVIRIGGVEVPEENVLFSGASVASVGVNEIVFEMPPGVPTGDAVPITVEIGGVVSRNDVTMAIE